MLMMIFVDYVLIFAKRKGAEAPDLLVTKDCVNHPNADTKRPQHPPNYLAYQSGNDGTFCTKYRLSKVEIRYEGFSSFLIKPNTN